jgi:hypothetical protein
VIEALLFWNLLIGDVLHERELEEPTTEATIMVEAAPTRDAPVVVEPEPEPEPAPQAQEAAPEPPVAAPSRNVWDNLADCESGNWVNGGASFETGSARWSWGAPNTIPPWGTSIHHGGLQFHPGTWDAYKLEGYSQYAFQASREQQIAVAERVLAVQGWGAWPTCAHKLGLL